MTYPSLLFCGESNKRNTFKSTYQVMDELSQKWGDLSDIAQASIIELMAGKHQGNVFASLMSNFDIARDALEVSANSAGSAMAEHAKWSESIEARLLKLKATWQSFAQSFMNSSFLKTGISIITKFVDILDKIISKFGTLPTILGAIGIGKFVKDLLFLKSDIKSFSTFIQAIGAIFPNLGMAFTNFFSTLKGGQGIVAALKIGIKGLWGVIAAHPILATVAAVGLAIAAYNHFVESADELAERIEEVTTKYKEQHSSLMKLKGSYDTSNEDSMISKYGRLSKGVNELGENVSLTADEYSEYQSIVNTIAGQIPSLITGYNSQGDAILGCAGDVDKLREAYEKLIIAQNNEVLKNGADIFKDFKNDLNEASDGLPYGDMLGNLEEFEDIINEKDFESYVNSLSGSQARQLSLILEENGIERDKLGSGEKGYESWKEHIIRAINESRTEAKEILDKASADINAYAEDLGTVTEAYFSNAFLGDYSHLSDRMQSVISQVTSGFDSDFYAQFLDDENPYESLTKYYNDLLAAFNNLSDAEAAEFEAAFDLKTQFNGGEISYGEYINGIKDAEKLIDGLGLDDEVATQIKLALDSDSIKKQYEEVYGYISRNYLNELDTVGMHGFEAQEFRTVEINRIKDLLNSLSATELQAVANIKAEIDWETANTDEILAQIKKEAEFLEAMSYTIAIDVEAESIEALNTAMAESVSGAGLSSEAITALKGRYAELESEGYNLSAMFEETSNGIHLNRKAVDELEHALTSSKLAETDKQLGVLKNRYDELTTEIDKCKDAGDRAALYTEQNSIIEKINDLATLAAQYEGLTSAYNAWQSAESAGSERDMYESVIEGFENIGDEISRGWLDDGTIKFLELMTGQTDLASKSASELKQVWKDLDKNIKDTTYSVKDFFTVDKDGNATSKGVYNFLDAIGQMEEEKFGGKDVIKRDDNGKIIGFDFELVAQKDENGNVIKNGDQVIAEALGISEELVQIMVRASDDAGFVVNLEGAYTQLADLKTEAEAARDSLISLKKQGNLKDVIGRTIDSDVNFDFDAEGNDLVAEQAKAVELLNKFKKDGEIDLSVKGAQDALDIAEYLTIKLDDLTEPKFMQIDTSEVEEDLREPIEKIQEIGKLCKEKHLVTLTGDTKELKEVQGEIDKVAEELANLKEDEKIKVGIDPEWDSKTIADKIEKGEIEIPAKLELDVQMSEDIKDMRLMMMNQLGLVSDDELKLKVGYEVDESTVDNLTPDEQKVAVELIAENEDEFNKLTEEEKEVVVDFVSDDSALEALENHQVEIEAFARIFGVEEVDDLKGKLESLDDEQILVLTEVLGRVDVEKLKTTIAGLDDKTVEAIAKALGEGDVDSLKTTINGLDDKTVQAIAEAFGYSGVDELNTAIDNLSPKTVQAIAQALGITDVDSLKAAIDRLTDKDVDAVANVSGEDDVNSLKTSIDNLKGKTITVWADIKKKASNLWDKLTGNSPAAGTAHAVGSTSGSAYYRGNWGIKGNGVALGGELGREIVVRDGKFFTIGDDGAEFFRYKKNDIVFNAAQTESLLKYGGIKGANPRGKMLAHGSAFVGGNAFGGSSGSGGGLEPKNPVTGKSYGSDSDSSDKDKEFEEVIDWIETIIDRVERAINKFEQQANNIYKSWSSRNNALQNQISEVSKEIGIQQKAYDKYISAANGVGLSEDYAKKVRSGEIDIETINDETLKEKIDDYRQWYEKALDCEKAVEELKETEASLYAQRFENVQTQYDSILQGYEHTEAMLNEYISQAEEQGHIVSKKYYNALIDNEKSNIAELKREQAELIAERDNAVADGKITKGSEAWLEQCAAIDEVTQAIEESTTALLEYDNAMREIDWSIFELIQERISDVTEEADFLIELMSNKELFEDDGKLTSQGLATMGLHAQNYNTYMYQADEYGAEVTKLNKQIESDPYDQELINHRNELLELQRESILAAEDEKNAVRDMVEEGINLELDSLQELIDKKNEELESERDLYEYQKKVKEQTKEIASLEKQMSAYSGDDSEEAKQKIQQIKVDLESARQDLQETEYDKFISDTSTLLDTLYNEYELILNTRLDNIDYLLESVIESINAAASSDGAIATALGSEGAISIAIGNNAISIKDTLTTEANKVGVTLSSAMNNIWSVGEGNAKSVLTMYGEDFKTKSTTIVTTLNSIKADIAAMVDDIDKDAQKKTTANKTTTSAKKEPVKTATNTTTNKTTSTTTKPSASTTTSSGGDGKPKVGDKVKFVSGQYYYDSQGKKPLGHHNRGKEVYITSINTKSWATHPYHISTGSRIGNGDLGWLKLEQLSGYASGKKNFLNNEVAWTQENGREFIVRPSDGAILTPIAKGDSVLTSAASGNIWNMANNPAEFIRNNLKMDASNIPNTSNVNNTYTQHIDKVVFDMENVKNYDELLSAMQKDKNFERLILSMSIDRIAGKSSLAKGKSIR